MPWDSLEALVDAAHALPGQRQDGPTHARRPSAALAPVTDASEVEAAEIQVAALRTRLGALLAELAARVEPALPVALERALRAWDQVDSLSVVDEPLRARSATLRRDAERLFGDEDPARRAAGLEATLTLDAALGLVWLLEHRLATLVRLRLRGPSPELLPAGRPFLDVAAALAEAARGWA